MTDLAELATETRRPDGAGNEYDSEYEQVFERGGSGHITFLAMCAGAELRRQSGRRWPNSGS